MSNSCRGPETSRKEKKRGKHCSERSYRNYLEVKKLFFERYKLSINKKIVPKVL